VTYDTQFTFGPHTDDKKTQSSQRVLTVSAVGGTTWGFDKETMLLTYKALVLPVFSYSPAVWVPNTKPSNIKKLQLVQNRCLRCITGCHQAASIDHLHEEAGILPVQDRLDMLCAQFLASAMRPMHPSHELVFLPPGPKKKKYGRPLKETLSSIYMEKVRPYLNDDGIMAEVFLQANLILHSHQCCVQLN
jgi:hypothetical protein